MMVGYAILILYLVLTVVFFFSSDGSYGPVFLRLAWHASGTYDKDSNTGGRFVATLEPFLIPIIELTHAPSNYATMRFEPEAQHGANNGLNVARDLMEKVKQQFPWISYGDLWTLGGVAAIQVRA
jgi:catalase (peroxidase I)